VRRFLQVVGALLVLAVLAVAGVIAWEWRGEIAATEPPSANAFDRTVVARGAQLALMGDCNSCHTRADGPAYAGGRPVPTPFGTLFSTNITPDPDTGIGRWSQAAFVRAMREGVDRRGRHLYPAFPYDYFTRASDEDLAALYAYFMTRTPVRAPDVQNALRFPFNMRVLLAGWKALFLRPGPMQLPKDSGPRERGAYLAEAIAHCGACHTPRNLFGATERSRPYAGGEAEGWLAPALDASAPAPVPWTADRIFTYLRQGAEKLHGAAAGPMAPVVHNLAQVPEQDVRAIAAYVASFGRVTPEREQKADQLVAEAEHNPVPAASSDADATGARIYAGACAECHDGAGLSSSSRALPLRLSTAVHAPDARNLLHFILKGLYPGEGESGPFMPSFANVLTDQQVVELARYLRATFGNEKPWSNLDKTLREVKATAAPRAVAANADKGQVAPRSTQ
jgi:mono/diheme cytochrome c family protein